MKCDMVMAVLIDKRSDVAPRVQEILTNYGCIIDSRLGLHKVQECAEEGLIILHLCGKDEQINNLEKELKALDRVGVNKMKIGFNN